MIVTTMNDLPGYSIDEVFGQVGALPGSTWTEICADGTAVRVSQL